MTLPFTFSLGNRDNLKRQRRKPRDEQQSLSSPSCLSLQWEVCRAGRVFSTLHAKECCEEKGLRQVPTKKGDLIWGQSPPDEAGKRRAKKRTSGQGCLQTNEYRATTTSNTSIHKWLRIPACVKLRIQLLHQETRTQIKVPSVDEILLLPTLSLENHNYHKAEDIRSPSPRWVRSLQTAFKHVFKQQKPPQITTQKTEINNKEHSLGINSEKLMNNKSPQK